MNRDVVKKRHVRDFIERKKHERAVALEGTEYINVHPFADDTMLLAELAWPAERCNSVDAYWHALSDVVFVQMAVTRRGDGERHVGRYARWDVEHGQLVLLFVMKDATIARTLFEGALVDLLRGETLQQLVDAGPATGEVFVPV